MAAVTESSAAMGMERRDWLKVSLATISRNHELKFGNISISNFNPHFIGHVITYPYWD